MSVIYSKAKKPARASVTVKTVAKRTTKDEGRTTKEKKEKKDEK